MEPLSGYVIFVVESRFLPLYDYAIHCIASYTREQKQKEM